MAISLIIHLVLAVVLTFSLAAMGYFLTRHNCRKCSDTLRKAKHSAFFSFAVMLLLFCSSIYQFHKMAHEDPIQYAAVNGLIEGGENAPFIIVPGIEIPGILGIYSNGNPNWKVPGIKDILYYGYLDTDSTFVPAVKVKKELGIKALQAYDAYGIHMQHNNYPVAKITLDYFNTKKQYIDYGLLKNPEDILPSINRAFCSFHILIYLSKILFIVFLVILWKLTRKDASEKTVAKYFSFLPLLICVLMFFCGFIVQDSHAKPVEQHDYPIEEIPQQALDSIAAHPEIIQEITHGMNHQDNN